MSVRKSSVKAKGMKKSESKDSMDLRGFCSIHGGPNEPVLKRIHCPEKLRPTIDYFNRGKTGYKAAVPYICDSAIKEIKSKQVPAKRRGRTAVLHPSEVDRIKNNVYQDPAIARKAIEDEENKKHELLELSVQLTQHFREIDQAKFADTKGEGDEIKKEKANEKFKTLDRAFIAKQEQQEEVRLMSRVIVNAKTKAFIDAQVMAKKVTDQKELDEKMRFDNILLDTEKKAINAADKKDEERRKRKHEYAGAIKEQIKENERLRFLESERQRKEAAGINEAHKAYLEYLERERLAACERRKKLRAEYDDVIELKNLFKKINCQQENAEEQARNEYMKAKIEKEKQLKEQKKELNNAFMQKQEELYKIGLKQVEAQNHRYEMNLIVQRESVERDYRRKELEAAQKKKKLLKELVGLREQEKIRNQHRQALGVAFAEKDFNELMDKLKREEDKANKEAEERLCRRACYRQDLINQINKRESDRQSEEMLKKNEAYSFKESERQRTEAIKAIVGTKIEAMRQACLPERYVREIEVQFHRLLEKRKML